MEPARSTSRSAFTSGLQRLPNELRLPILSFLLGSPSPSAYALEPSIESALRALAHTDRTWRNLTLRHLYARAVVRRAEDISLLLACAEGLQYVQSLVLLRGDVDWASGRERHDHGHNGHSYCAKELTPLFAALGPTLKRLLVVHDFARRLRDCHLWPAAIGSFAALEELVVDSPSFMLPFSLLRWQNRGMLNWITACPRLTQLRRLATNRDRTWWREFEYGGLFPEVRELLFCERQGGQTDERDVLAMRDQMLERPGLKVGIVEDRMVYESRSIEWERFERHLPPGRFELELVDEPENWFVRRALQGGLFELGEEGAGRGTRVK